MLGTWVHKDESVPDPLPHEPETVMQQQGGGYKEEYLNVLKPPTRTSHKQKMNAGGEAVLSSRKRNVGSSKAIKQAAAALPCALPRALKKSRIVTQAPTVVMGSNLGLVGRPPPPPPRTRVGAVSEGGAARLFVARHAERLDRALEAEGKTWIQLAVRPHDPPLSPHGREQARRLGRHLRDKGISRILCSPLIRTTQTADLIAAEIGLGEDSIWPEDGLCEDAVSMRYPSAPVLLAAADLRAISDRVNMEYVPLRPVRHRADPGCRIRDIARKPKKYVPGEDREIHNVRELHDTIPPVDTEQPDQQKVLRELNRITADRCAVTVTAILADKRHVGETLLLVGHGASCRWAISHLTQMEVNESGPVAGYSELIRQEGRGAGSWVCAHGYQTTHLDGWLGAEGDGDNAAQE